MDYTRKYKEYKYYQIFTFLADNITNSSSMVEFALAQTGIQGDKGLNFITTGHCKSEESGMGRLLRVQLFNGYTIRSILHSHPISLNASIADYKFKKYVIDEQKRKGSQIPMFEIYHTPTQVIIEF